MDDYYFDNFEPDYYDEHDDIDLFGVNYNDEHDIIDLIEPDSSEEHDDIDLFEPDSNEEHDDIDLFGVNYNDEHDIIDLIEPDSNEEHDNIDLFGVNYNDEHDIIDLIEPDSNEEHDDIDYIDPDCNEDYENNELDCSYDHDSTDHSELDYNEDIVNLDDINSFQLNNNYNDNIEPNLNENIHENNSDQAAADETENETLVQLNQNFSQIKFADTKNVDSIDCPAKCKQLVSKDTIVEHFKQFHAEDCYTDGKIELNFGKQANTFQKLCLVESNGNYYIALADVEHFVNKKLFKVLLFSLGQKSETKFDVSINWSLNDILKEYSFSKTKNTTNFDKLLHLQSLLASVVAYELKSNPKRKLFGKIKIQLLDTLNSELLSDNLDCPVCKNFMSGEIRLCNKGHSFCGKCRSQMDQCPLCRDGIGDSRNYLLEEIIKSLAAK